MSMKKFTPRPWNFYIKQMTGSDGTSIIKYYIEKDGYLLAQFANFGDENEANLKLCTSAPDMYALLGRLEDYFQNRHIYGDGVDESVSSDLLREIKKVMKRAEGKMVEQE